MLLQNRKNEPSLNLAVWAPLSEADRQAVHDQLSRLLSSSLFCQSQRFSNLLRYLVERSLDARNEHLKERTIGMEVFGRDPSYDTTADPVVRTTAAQLRRRIARYYLESNHESEIIVELPPGTYLPVFRKLTTPRLSAAASSPADSIPIKTRLIDSRFRLMPAIPRNPLASLRKKTLAGVIAAALVLAAFLVHRSPSNPALEAFWGPVWGSANSVLVCVGTQHTDSLQPEVEGPNGAALSIRQFLWANSVRWPDAITASSIVALAASNRKSWRLRRSDGTSFTQLKDSPTILVGGFNNEWIMRLGKSLRFHYEVTEDGVASIEDRRNPQARDWKVNFKAPFSEFAQDYGIVSRIADADTQQFIVMASGIAAFGTMTAGDILTNEKYMEQVAARAPKDWSRKNVQVVFSTPIIGGVQGAPNILAIYFW